MLSYLKGAKVKLNLLPIFVILFSNLAMAYETSEPKTIAKCGDYGLEQYEYSVDFGANKSIKHTKHEYQLRDKDGAISLSPQAIGDIAILDGGKEIQNDSNVTETLNFRVWASSNTFRLDITSMTSGPKSKIPCEVVR